MKQKFFILPVIIVCLSLIAVPLSGAQEYSYHYKGIKNGALKLMELRAQLSKKLRPEKRNKIDFSIAEYYFGIKAFIDAKQAFEQYLGSESVDISRLLVNIYLLKIARRVGDDKEMTAIKKGLFKDQFVLLFENHKTLQYTSLFGNEYEVKYFVDRIEIFLNGDKFDEIIP